MRMAALCLAIGLISGVGTWCGPALADAPACFYCGMYQSKYEHSWMVITRVSGSSVSVCSIHCAVIDMALHPDQTIRGITVGDYDSKKQIEADSAFWVIGGDIVGVMTARAKWAFGSKENADRFIKEHGGQPANFSDVIKAAFEDMYQDTLMIRKKQKLLRMRKNESR